MSGPNCEKIQEDINRSFYDDVSDYYELSDGRRRRSGWIDAKISSLQKRAPGLTCVDVGAGTGFVTNIARKYYPYCIAVDLSERMLGHIHDPAIYRLVGMATELPVLSGCTDLVICFATLHHVYDYAAAIREAGRILRPGGILYTDHDLDNSFYHRWSFLIDLYRKIRNPAKRYKDHRYSYVETHNNGIKKSIMEKALHSSGFCFYEFKYHWQGLLPIAGDFPRGLAPLISLTAVKG